MPEAWAVKLRGPWAVPKLAVKVKLAACPPARLATEAGCTAVKLEPVPLVAMALGETLRAAEVPRLRTVSTPVTGAPVPAKLGRAVKLSMLSDAGIWMTT